MKTFLSLLLSLVPFVSFAQPVIRNPITTNRFMIGVPSNGQVPAWNTAAGRWSNSTLSASSSAQVWTNDNQSIRPVGFPFNFRITPSNSVDQPIVMMGGTNGSNWMNNGFGGNAIDYSILSVRVADDGDRQFNNVSVASASDVNGNAYGIATLRTATNIATVATEMLNSGGFQRFEAGYVNGGRIILTTNGTTAFAVDGSGGISTMKGVAQNWPQSQGAANTVLVNDGSGNFTWGSPARTATTVAGAGSGSTNYLITLSSNALNDFHLGSSNVHIYTVGGGTLTQPIYWNAYITNLSAITWGINFSPSTNRWRFSGTYGTNAPSVLTNNTLLMLSGRSDGTNTLVGYTYFNPGL